MEVTRAAEAHWATQYRSTGEMEFSCSQHDCSVEWAMHIFIGFPKEDSQKRTLLWQIPGLRSRGRVSGRGIWGWRGHKGIRRANANSIPIFDKSTLLMNRSLAFFGRQELIKNLCVFYTRRLLCKESSKKGLTRRPLCLVRFEWLVCTVEMIGRSRSTGDGRDTLPRVRRCTSRRFFLLLLRTRSRAIGAEALSCERSHVSEGSSLCLRNGGFDSHRGDFFAEMQSIRAGLRLPLSNEVEDPKDPELKKADRDR